MENKTIMALCVGAILMTTACDKGGSGSADATATTAPKAQKEYVGEVLATVNGLNVGAEDYKAAAARKVPANGTTLSTEEKTEVLLMQLHALNFSSNVLEKVLQMDPFGDLWVSFCRSGGPLGAQRVPKVVKKVDQMRLRNRPWQPGGPECYPNAAQGCPGPRKRS